MGRIISVLADDLSFLSHIGSAPINGGMMSVAELVRRFIEQDTTEAIEFFVPPMVMLRADELRDAAREFLPSGRRGEGALRFYPLHSLPEVWGDGAPRVLYCADAEWLPQQRYLRDRFAVGPMPIVADTHSLAPHSFWTSMQKLATSVPVAYDSILCRSPSTRQAMERGFSWLAAGGTQLQRRLDDLHYGLDVETFHPVNSEFEKQNARRSLNLPLSGTITTFFGRVTAYSKADMLPLLASFAAATERSDDYLLIAGKEFPSGYIDKLREAGEALGLGERLLLRGEAAPVLRPLFYLASDIFVFPGDTTIETFGNTVIEAMGCGLPVVVSDWDGLRRHFDDGVHGFSVPTWWMPGIDRISAFSPFSRDWSAQLFLGQSVWVDTQVLTDSLQRLLDDPGLRARMGAAGREHVLITCSWKSVMEAWEKLWAELEELAAAESAEDAECRRAGADRLALPMPYLELFGHYATGVFDPLQHAVRLSGFGRAVIEGYTLPSFYDETLPLLHDPIINALLVALSEAPDDWMSIAILTQSAAATWADEDMIRFHIGVMLKRGLLEVTALSS